jgi:hypothetical protein
MKCSKSFNSVVAILEALTENGMLEPGCRKDIAKLVRDLRRILRKGTHKEALFAVDKIARRVVDAIKSSQE